MKLFANIHYLQVGILVAPEAKSHLRGSLLDFFYTYKQVWLENNINLREVDILHRFVLVETFFSY